MSPTANAQLAIFRGRLIKTAKAREFEKQVRMYERRNEKTIKFIRDDIAKWIESGLMVKADFHFCFNRSDLIGKKGQLKRIDRTNRLKNTEDAVSAILGIDDKFITTGLVEKVIIESSEEKEQCAIIVIQPAPRIRTDIQVIELASF